MTEDTMSQEVSEEATFMANPAVFLIQSRLYSPGYSGMGRWVLFDPTTRKAFVAVGKESFPPIVEILAIASGRPVSRRSLMEMGIEVSPEQIDMLVNNGLLVETQDASMSTTMNYVQRYHRAVYDYPFLDYHDPAWKEQDRATMKAYGEISPPPPTTTPRDGEMWALPEVDIVDLEPVQCEGGTLSLRVLAAVLRYAFGAIGTIPGGDFGPWLRKTSPSGGARHPTEGVILFSTDWSGIPAGAYVYDVDRHALVREGDIKAVSPFPNRDAGVGFGLLIRSRVERPMWRYRDIRSFRPVLMDAGHVVETLVMLFGHLGHVTRVVLPSLCNTGDLRWVEEPELACLLVGSWASMENAPAVADGGECAIHERSDTHTTNPAMYMTFVDGRIVAHILWPEAASITIDEASFLVLMHCLPSRRGDRRIDRDGILAAIPGATVETLALLRSNQALLSVEMAKPFYHAIDLWVRHGWYVSLIAHMEVRAAIIGQSQQQSQPAVVSRDFNGDLTRALMQRRTTRAFSQRAIKRSDLISILISANLASSSMQRSRLVVATLSVEDTDVGVYEWDQCARSLSSVGKQLDRETIRTLTIGQKWAAEGAAVLWLLNAMDLEHPAQYELDLLEMGRIGQRICLAAVVAGLGVFTTPAVSDARICEELGVEWRYESVFYTFTVGYANA